MKLKILILLLLAQFVAYSQDFRSETLLRQGVKQINVLSDDTSGGRRPFRQHFINEQGLEATIISFNKTDTSNIDSLVSYICYDSLNREFKETTYVAGKIHSHYCEYNGNDKAPFKVTYNNDGKINVQTIKKYKKGNREYSISYNSNTLTKKYVSTKKGNKYSSIQYQVINGKKIYCKKSKGRDNSMGMPIELSSCACSGKDKEYATHITYEYDEDYKLIKKCYNSSEPSYEIKYRGKSNNQHEYLIAVKHKNYCEYYEYILR